MKKKAKLIPWIIVAILFAALFCVNRYNTHKRHSMALETIRAGVINYVFSGTYEADHLNYKYTFTFVDENTVTVKRDAKDRNGKRTGDIIVQDFGYRIVTSGDSFKLKVGRAKNKISSVYGATKLGPSEGTFLLTDYSYEGEGVHRAIHGISMQMKGSGYTSFDKFILDLKTPNQGSKTIRLPGDIRLD